MGSELISESTGEAIGGYTLPGKASALHEYLRFLTRPPYKLPKSIIFDIEAGTTLEQKKQGRTSVSRSQDTYDIKYLTFIKDRVDDAYDVSKSMARSDPTQFKINLTWKLRAYAILIGVFTGIRRGNLVGMKLESLQPDDARPHFIVRDNVVKLWSRGQKGSKVFPLSTKLTQGTEIALPFMQPDVETCKEVCYFLFEHLKPGEFLLTSPRKAGKHVNPDLVSDWWKIISKHCGFKHLSPHDWKHSYATIGGLYLEEIYEGDKALLRECCLHEKFETTESYFRKKSTSTLDRLYKASSHTGKVFIPKRVYSFNPDAPVGSRGSKKIGPKSLR